MANIDFKLDGKVALVTLNEGENQFNLDICTTFLDILDEVEKGTEAAALIVKSGHDNIWSTGYDLGWIDAKFATNEEAEVIRFLLKMNELRRRLLLYPMATICVINGHIFGGGAVLSLCFDFRFMRLERGYFCVPLVDRSYPILPGTAALLKQVLPSHMVQQVLLTGRRYTAAECLENHLITAAYENSELMDKVLEFARTVSKSRWIVGQVKKEINGGLTRLMEKDHEHMEPGRLWV